MALNGNALGDAVVTALEGVDGSMTDDQKAQLTTAWHAIGTAIVTYITANAQVASSVTVSSVTGVTSGPGTSGPGSGSATGTIS